MSAIRPLVPGTLLVLGIALTGLGRAQVFMPVLFLGQVLTLLGSRQCGWRVLAGIGCPVLMISTSLVFLGSAYDLFGGLDRYLMAMAFATALNLGAWLIDQWAVGRLPGFAAPLVFPAVRIPIEVAAAFGGPLGLWGSFAAPAAGLWPISGLVAYGGFSLLSFVLLWLASSIAYFWHGLLVDQRPTSWRVLIPCLSVLTFCNIALSWGSPAVDHIRVAAIAAPQLSRAYSADDYAKAMAYGRGQLEAAAIVTLRAGLIDTATQTFRLVEQAADQGAQIIYSAEGDIRTLDSDRADVEQMASQIARARHIWLGVGLAEFRPDARPMANMIQLFGPDGRLISTYEKTHPIGAETTDMRIGTAPPDIVQTPMAKIAGVICYDTEFVSFTRAVARAGADILFAPSNDWPQIAIMRAAVTRYRALETGMALVRPTRNGVSEIISADGRVLAQSPYDPNTGTVLVADIDARAIPTVYTQGGDWPGGAALLLLIILFGWAMQRGRHLAARHRAL